MKKFSILIIALLMPMLATAQKYSTGITPYTFQKAWEYLLESQQQNRQNAEADNLLKKLGYTYVGAYNYQDTNWTNHVYAKGCVVTVGSDGFVKTAKAKGGNKYANYIEFGPGVGMDCSMKVTFLTSTGSSYFINLLKKSKYQFRKNSSSWVRPATKECIFQEGKEFYYSEARGYED